MKQIIEQQTRNQENRYLLTKVQAVAVSPKSAQQT